MENDLGYQGPIGRMANEPQNWKAALEVDALFWQIFGTCRIFEKTRQSLSSLLANNTLASMPCKREIDRPYDGRSCLRGSLLGHIELHPILDTRDKED